MAEEIDINADMVRWAVQRSGMSVDSFPEFVKAWIARERKPTYRQLATFAKRAMVPFGFLFLDRPPKEDLPLPDYRTRKDQKVEAPSPNLIETVYEMEQRQDWMHEYLVAQGYSKLGFVGSADTTNDIIPLVERIQKQLRLPENWAGEQTSYTAALNFLRSRVEEAEILIFINGIVGNNTSRKLDPVEFQGFVLSDELAPLIFVNGADFKVAQMFTIAHELVHVWLGKSALFDLVATRPANYDIEKYCNAVAAEFLVPASRLKAAWNKRESPDVEFVNLGNRFKVSPVVVARRAKDLRLVDAKTFFGFYERYMTRQRETHTEATGGNFWATQKQKVGQRFGEAVIAAAEEGSIPYTQAYSLVDLYGDTFDKFAERLQQKGNE